MTGGAANVQKGKATQRAVAEFYRKIGRCVVYENSDPGQPKGKHGHRGTPGRTPGLHDSWVRHDPEPQDGVSWIVILLYFLWLIVLFVNS